MDASLTFGVPPLKVWEQKARSGRTYLSLTAWTRLSMKGEK